MTQADAFHMVRLISVLDTRMFVRVATSTGAYPTKHIARPSYANVTRMPLAADARVAQITRANEMIARLANPRLAGIERDTTVQLAGILERTMGAERAKRFCEMSFWAFYDAKDDENADTWEVMRVFIDMEFLCQMGRPFHLEHFRRDIEIISDQEGGRIVFAGGAFHQLRGNAQPISSLARRRNLAPVEERRDRIIRRGSTTIMRAAMPFSRAERRSRKRIVGRALRVCATITTV